VSSVPDIVSPEGNTASSAAGIRRELGVTKMRKLSEISGLKMSYIGTFGTFLYAPSHEQSMELELRPVLQEL
jgi:hypothetical protein